MALDWKRGDLDYRKGRNSSLWGWWGTGTGCPEKLWMFPPWKCSRPGWTGLWATWASGRCPCPWQGCWSLRSLSAQTIPWFCEYLWPSYFFINLTVTAYGERCIDSHNMNCCCFCFFQVCHQRKPGWSCCICGIWSGAAGQWHTRCWSPQKSSSSTASSCPRVDELHRLGGKDRADEHSQQNKHIFWMRRRKHLGNILVPVMLVGVLLLKLGFTLRTFWRGLKWKLDKILNLGERHCSQMLFQGRRGN